MSLRESRRGSHGEEEKCLIYPGQTWTSISTRIEYEKRYPHLPDRIIDNLLAPNAFISVVPWERLSIDRLKFLVDVTFNRRGDCEYDLSKPMRRRDS